MTGIYIESDKVDWPMLRAQKSTLIEWKAGRGIITEDKVDTTEVLSGIIHLLDYIQDQAAIVLGEEEVFGKEVSNEAQRTTGQGEQGVS